VRYVGKFAQVQEIISNDSENKTKRYMFHHNHGCCVLVGIMGPTQVPGVNDSLYNDKDNDTVSSDL
jgi:hypothetical protein